MFQVSYKGKEYEFEIIVSNELLGTLLLNFGSALEIVELTHTGGLVLRDEDNG